MNVSRDFRTGRVSIEMSLDSMRETVEWLELLDPRDAATQEWRAAYDEIAPREEAEDGSVA